VVEQEDGDLDRLQKRAGRNPHAVSCVLAALTPCRRTGLAARRGRRSAEPGLMVLLCSKSNSRQKSALAAAKANSARGESALLC